MMPIVHIQRRCAAPGYLSLYWFTLVLAHGSVIAGVSGDMENDSPKGRR
jgi:hypothetical protein